MPERAASTGRCSCRARMRPREPTWRARYPLPNTLERALTVVVAQ